MLGNETGLAYVLRERALVRLAEGNSDGAKHDATEGIDALRRRGDQLGLAGMLRVAARIAHVGGQKQLAYALLTEAAALVADGSNPLAEAGVLLMRAEIDPDRAARRDAARQAAVLYEGMAVAPGHAHALTLAARAEMDSEDRVAALALLRTAATIWMRARALVSEPARRADHDFALRDVVTVALRTAADLGGNEADALAADILVQDAPLGLRRAMRTGEIGERAKDVISRARAPSVRSRGSRTTRVLLQQLGFALSTVQPESEDDVVRFEQLRDAHPAAAILAVAQPTRDSELPVAWAIPHERTRFRLSPLTTAQIDAVDDLGRAVVLERTDVLWEPNARGWQDTLASAFLPQDLVDWLVAHEPAELVIVLPPVLAHVPVEALLIEGRPLGVIAAVRRLPVVSASRDERDVRAVVAYLDPALPWAHERAACPQATVDGAAFRASLGERQLILIGCHGDSAVRIEGTLTATGGVRILDAIDLLAQSLRHGVVVLEACFAGRYFGPRTGEQLNLATVALLAGASEAIAGLFALPANDHTTGRIAGHALLELQAGVSAPEALRRARATYWSRRDQLVPRPGPDQNERDVMLGDSPWAWAGLCAYGR